MKKIICFLIAVLCFTCGVEAKKVFKSLRKDAVAYQYMNKKDIKDTCKSDGGAEFYDAFKDVNSVECVMFLAGSGVNDAIKCADAVVADKNLDLIDEYERNGVLYQIYAINNGENYRQIILKASKKGTLLSSNLALIYIDGELSPANFNKLVDTFNFELNFNFKIVS